METTDYIEVDASRLESSIFDGTEGDISGNMSSERLLEYLDKPGQPIRLGKNHAVLINGHLYACTGMHWAAHGKPNEAVCYPLIPQGEYQGPQSTPRSNEGIPVIWREQPYRLGPKTRVRAGERSVEFRRDEIRRMYAHGGHFAAGKTYQQVLDEWVAETPEDAPENHREAITLELQGELKPATQAEMLQVLRNPAGANTTTTQAKPQLELTL